jgi:hypothetical protein
MKYRKFLLLTILLFLTATAISLAQGPLSRSITLDVSRQRLDHVLEIISNKGDFYFSYNSNLVRRDSLVSFRVQNKPVREILTSLFSTTAYEFIESGNYIIIRRRPIQLTMVTKKAVAEERIYSVSGYVYDEESGNAINEASIYEKRLLSSALTNDNGFFKIKLKSSKASFAELTVSKEFYLDTTVKIEPRHNQELTITLTPMELIGSTVIITPRDVLIPDSLKPDFSDTPRIAVSFRKTDTIKVERTGVGRFLLSTKQKVQSLNLKHFFTTRPFQLSLTPGLSTHGKLSPQVVNNFSLNAFGGYTGGTNGIEVGGLFNIDKKDVRYVQAAGLFNIVGGRVTGVQVGGLHNTVLDSMTGVQAAGINNLVKGKMTGAQIGGIYNHVTDSVKGMQAAGIGNFAKRKVSGVQIAGIANVSSKETDGAQIAGIINYSKKLRGVQIGLINISDTSEGYSIGLINVVLKGYHKLSFFTNEVLNVNAAFKTGNSKLYSVLQAGIYTDKDTRAYSFGYGLGSELPLNKKKNFSINPEITSQYIYLGSWDYINILNRFQLNLNFKLNKYVSFFAGPAYSIFVSDQETGVTGYRFPVHPSSYKTNSLGNNVSGWFGWTAGINFF